MMMNLHKKLLCCYILSSSSSFSTKTLLYFSTAVTTKHSSSEQPTHFMVDYLINLCGFSPDRANRASKRLTHMKSPSNADSVLHFLRQSGFNETHIRDLIRREPRLLSAKVDKTLKPKFTALQDLGFSESDLIQLISKNPISLKVVDLRPRIQFFQSLLGTNDNLLKAFSRNRFLLATSLDARLVPNISFLRGLGIPDCEIAKIVIRSPGLISRSPSSLKETVKRADEFGVCRGSGMFLYLLDLVSRQTKATLDVKFKLLKSLGWSEVEIISALRKHPSFLFRSEDNTRCKMEFFMKELECDLSYVTSHPIMFSFSMERRLIPRYCILRLLKRQELQRGRNDLSSIMKMTEKGFIEKFVLPYKDKIPGLHETYVAACTGKVSKLETNQDLKVK